MGAWTTVLRHTGPTPSTIMRVVPPQVVLPALFITLIGALFRVLLGLSVYLIYVIITIVPVVILCSTHALTLPESFQPFWLFSEGGQLLCVGQVSHSAWDRDPFCAICHGVICKDNALIDESSCKTKNSPMGSLMQNCMGGIMGPSSTVQLWV